MNVFTEIFEMINRRSYIFWLFPFYDTFRIATSRLVWWDSVKRMIIVPRLRDGGESICTRWFREFEFTIAALFIYNGLWSSSKNLFRFSTTATTSTFSSKVNNCWLFFLKKQRTRNFRILGRRACIWGFIGWYKISPPVLQFYWLRKHSSWWLQKKRKQFRSLIW